MTILVRLARRCSRGALMHAPAYVLGLGLLALFSACQTRTPPVPPTDWSGAWTYEAPPSTSAGGSPITMRYRLTVPPGDQQSTATLTIEGFQTDETLLCEVDRKPASLTVRFRSYPDGGVLNAFGVAIHRPGDQLLTLTAGGETAEGPITTEWQGLDPPDEKMPRVGRYFSRARQD